MHISIMPHVGDRSEIIFVKTKMQTSDDLRTSMLGPTINTWNMVNAYTVTELPEMPEGYDQQVNL